MAGSDGALLPKLLSDISTRPRRHFDQPPMAIDGPFGAGDAAQRIVAAICDLHEVRT